MQAEGAISLPKRKRNSDDGELDVTPMIDVTFLLLAFFVVVSKMDPQASVPLPMASAGLSISKKECVTIIMTVDDAGQTPNIFLGTGMTPEERVPDGDPESQEEAIAEFVESQFTEDPTKNAVLIKASGDCKTGMVELVKRGVAGSTLATSDERKVYVGIEEEQ
jgi:biopolymer transport protein TolR